MKMKSIISAIIVLALLAGCDSSMWESGDYEVYYIDGDINLGIKIDDEGTWHGRVDHEVVAVGVNEKYVVAKQIEFPLT